MCETPGYTSPKAGGREVKCANSKCLVPLFTCPEPPPPPVEEAPPEPAGFSTTQLGLISVIALAAIGAGIWFFVLKDDSKIKPPKPDGGPIADNGNNGKTQPEIIDNGPKPVQPAVPQGPDLTKLREEAPAKMVLTSQLPSGRGVNRPKPLRVQATALAFAEIGDLKNAQEQLGRLSSFNDDEPHYRVLPWVKIAWQLRARKESKEATEAANKALEFANNHPASEHESWLEAVSLCGLLVALGRMDETAPVLERKLGRPEDQELWADIVAVNLDGSFNLDKMEQVRPVVMPVNSTWSGIVRQLVFHDAVAEGLAWAKHAADPQTRGEALIAWADAVATRALAKKQPAQHEGLDAAIQELPAPWPNLVMARAYARMGQRHAIAGDSATAATLLQTALKAMSSLPEPKPMTAPDLKTIYQGGFSLHQPAEHVAVAAFEVARLQAALKQPKEAWKSIERGLAALRSESLPLSQTEQLLAKLKTEGDFLRGDLKNALALANEDQARQAFRTYQKHVNELQAQAESRLRLQTALLSRAAEWNLGEAIYRELTQWPESAGGDSYFKTDLPWVLLAELKAEGSQSAAPLEAMLKEKRVSKPRGQTLLENSARAMKDLDTPKVLDAIGRGTPALPDPVRRRWILRLSSREVLAGHTGDVLSFLLGLFNVDPFLGEDAAELIAGLATQNGQGETIWEELDQRSWQPTQKLAAYLGFIAAVPPKPPAESESK